MVVSPAMRIAAGFLFAVVVSAQLARAAPPPDTDSYVHDAMKAFGAPGLALAIVEDGKTTLAKGYGVRNIDTGSAVDSHTAFPIGSESKAFTAAALAILVDRKMLSWDDRVADRLPGFRMFDPYATAHMTVRDLLTHRSGLGLGEGDLLVIPGTTRSRTDIVHALRYLQPVTGFRETFAYDNILYIVAGALVEAISGKNWESFVAENIFIPLGMLDAHPYHDVSAPNAVALHARTSGPLRGVGQEGVLAESAGFRTISPAGGINASAEDMARWMTLQLDHGRMANGRALFSETQADILWTPVVVVPPEAFKLPPAYAAMQPDLQTYALGWFVESYRGHIVIEHTGAVFGALSMLYLIPDIHTGLSVSINSEDSGTRRAVMFHLLDHYLGLKPTDWIARLQAGRAESVRQAQSPVSASVAISGAAQPILPLASYAGSYSDPWYGHVAITQPSPGRLSISFSETPGMEGRLETVGGNRFRTVWSDRNIENAYLDFAVRDGKISGIRLSAISKLADFSFDYQDLHLSPAPRLPDNNGLQH